MSKSFVTKVVAEEIPTIWWGIYGSLMNPPVILCDSKHYAELVTGFLNSQNGHPHYTVAEVQLNPPRGY